jgi:hypothetical protein
MKRKGNLSEELYNMRKLMNFNSEKFRAETTSLDRLVEEKMVKKYLINEQLSSNLDNALSINQISKIVANDQTNRSKLNQAQQRGNCVFIKSPKVTTVAVETEELDAQFYNNMVSLDRGLMPETPLTEIQSQIQKIVNNINETNLNNLEIEITGTATEQTASNEPDKRLLKKNPNMQLDHPGSDYGGQKANNEYLAKQRANSIKVVFEKLLPTAKFTVISQVIPGGSLDDTSRYIQVKIKGDKKTDDIVTVNDIWMNWVVSYEEVIGTTKGQRSQFIQNTSAAGYKATLLIEYGQKNTPVFNGKVYYESAEKQTGNDQNTISDPERATQLRYPYLYKGAGTTSNPNFSTFLASCGYFGKSVAYDIGSYVNIKEKKNSIYRVDSEVFKKLAQKKTGNLQDFIQIAGGSSSRKIDASQAMFAYVYDITVTPPTLTMIK